MKIALIGYGKMGKEIEQMALERGHQICFRISHHNASDLHLLSIYNTDIAIEFSQPEAAFENIQTALKNKVSVVCGTTGWLERLPEIERLVKSNQASFFYASNFSLGVNLFFKLNELLAKIMSNYPKYALSIEEIHHTEKKDAPSGTAISLAEGVIGQNPDKQYWINGLARKSQEIGIISKREPHVPGTHSVFYSSEEDVIEIKHQAHSRKGFALGAVLAAEFVVGKKGIFGMNDLLNNFYE